MHPHSATPIPGEMVLCLGHATACLIRSTSAQRKKASPTSGSTEQRWSVFKRLWQSANTLIASQIQHALAASAGRRRRYQRASRTAQADRTSNTVEPGSCIRESGTAWSLHLSTRGAESHFSSACRAPRRHSASGSVTSLRAVARRLMGECKHLIAPCSMRGTWGLHTGANARQARNLRAHVGMAGLDDLFLPVCFLAWRQFTR